MRFPGLLTFALTLLLMSPASGADPIPMVDAHSQIDTGVDTERVVPLMDQAGIRHAILSSLRGASRTRDVVETARRYPDRITASIGLKDRRYREGVPEALRRVQQMAAKPIFGALAEVMVLHEEKPGMAPEVMVEVDAPAVRTALDAARKRRWPLVLHIEFGFAYGQNRLNHYMAGLEHLAEQNRDIAMALTHMGQLNAANVRRLIQAHSNIYFLTSHANTIWIVRRRSDLAWTNLFADDILAPEWKALMVRHPDRFILAFDNVYDGDWSDFYVDQVRLWKAALATLRSEAAHAIAHGNAERLWRLPTSAAGMTTRRPRPDASAPRGRNAADVVRNLDADGDGRLSPAEFPGPPPAFKRADSNGDAYLSADELAAFRKRRRIQ